MVRMPAANAGTFVIYTVYRIEMTYRVEKWSAPHAPNPAMLRHILTLEGYLAYEWGDRAGMVYPTHKHETDQSHWVVSGCLEIIVERFGTFVLEAGDRDFMPAGTYHSARVIGDDNVLYLIGERPFAVS